MENSGAKGQESSEKEKGGVGGEKVRSRGRERVKETE
jgi:hypothetical protein